MRSLNDALDDPALKARPSMSHYAPISGSPEQLTKKMKKETEVTDQLSSKVGFANN